MDLGAGLGHLHLDLKGTVSKLRMPRHGVCFLTNQIRENNRLISGSQKTKVRVTVDSD